LQRDNLPEARALIASIGAVAQVHRRGFHWVRGQLLPALRTLAQSGRRRDQRLAARGRHLLGTVHDLNGAPRAALREFQRCLGLDPRCASAWRDIGGMLENLGEPVRARRALLKAAALAPRDKVVPLDLQRVELAIVRPPAKALYAAGDHLWEAGEALAARRYAAALAQLGRRRAIRAYQLRACVYGARGATAEVVEQWSRIARARDEVSFCFADWFYALQGPVADSSELWRLMLWKIRTKLGVGSFCFPPSLWDIDVPTTKRFELYARYQLARCEGDSDALLALARTYPSWREPGEAALRLASL